MLRNAGFALGATGAVCSAALCSTHHGAGGLEHSEIAAAGVALKVLSHVGEGLQNIALPRSALESYARYVGQDATSVGDARSIHAYRIRSTPVVVQAGEDGERGVLAPVGGVIESFGMVGARGALLGTEVRTLLGADGSDPISAGAVAVGGRVEAAPSALRYVTIRPGVGDSSTLVAPAAGSIRARLVEGSLASCRPGTAERTVYTGRWKHGLLAVVALSGVGRRACAVDDEEQRVERGESLGNEALVARVVVLFESPDAGFKALVQPGDTVQLGGVVARVDADTSVVKEAKEEQNEKRTDMKSGVRGTTYRARRTW